MAATGLREANGRVPHDVLCCKGRIVPQWRLLVHGGAVGMSISKVAIVGATLLGSQPVLTGTLNLERPMILPEFSKNFYRRNQGTVSNFQERALAL